MELATGAMGCLLPKLAELHQEQYNLRTHVKKDIESLERELRSMEFALRKVAEVPRDQLDMQVCIWGDEARELSYEMEDVLDSFMVRVEGSEPATDLKSTKRFRKKIASFFKNDKTQVKEVANLRDRYNVAGMIQDIKDRVQELAARRDRYKIDDVHANSAATSTVDPRLLALYKNPVNLIGIEGPRDELIKRLIMPYDGVSNQQLKIVSIFGFAGLGKTTLAKAVYDKLRGEFFCRAFVSVGQNPNLKKVLMDIFCELDDGSYSSATMLDEGQLIKELKGLLENKRYLIIIDDIWDKSSWEVIRCAWIDSNCGSRIITTTRIIEVAKLADEVYKQEPLSPSRSKELFYQRLSIGKGFEICEKILQKCGGVPLAIITIASLLVHRPREDWSEIYDSIGFGYEDNMVVDNMRRILLYSYYDLPCYLKTCLLHLSVFPEDYEIEKDTLIWKWVGEGFVHEKPGMGLFELGEKYFNELINRSMIQPIEEPHQGIVYACRVHDMVLDMIYSLSKEENFFVILGSYPQRNARRLAVQKRVIDQDDPMANTPMFQVRSFNATMCHINMMPSLLSFQCLRVLALEGCIFVEDRPYHLEHLGRLVQLRYLGLSDMPITELPSEIGNLRFLQTIVLCGTEIKELPRSVGQLRQLKCLRLEGGMISVSDWIGNLTSLEEASVEYVYPNSVKELGKLTELRVFKAAILGRDPQLFKDMMDSLGNMHRLQAIHIVCWAGGIDWTNYEGCVLPWHLRHVELRGVVFPRLPTWMDSSHLPLLSHLELNVNAMEAKDVEILGKFPELLTLQVQISNHFVPDVIGGGAFPKLRCLYMDAKLRFLQGAMPSLECITSFVGWQACKAANLNGDFASIKNLPCLQKVIIFIGYARKSDLEKAEAALRHAVKVHSNNPTLQLIPTHFSEESDSN